MEEGLAHFDVDPAIMGHISLSLEKRALQELVCVMRLSKVLTERL